jgi:hypothetical protein
MVVLLVTTGHYSILGDSRQCIARRTSREGPEAKKELKEAREHFQQEV